MGWLIGVDTGGTFTDLVAVHEETRELRFAKVPSTPHDPSLGVMAALEQLLEAGVQASHICFFAHGTTVGTNALLEGKGASTGLMITRGFRAVYEARGFSQPSGAALIDPFYQKPALLVPQRRTAEITGRLNAKGEVLQPLDESDVRDAARRMAKQGVCSVAVCFLFSYVDDRHEVRAAEIIRETAPNMRVSVSSAVLPVIREYIRTSTTVVDAFVGPGVETYIIRLADRLAARGISTRQLFVMQSHGGLVRMEAAPRYAGQLLLSGPAAGLIAAARLGAATGCPNVVTFDVGGTSTDIGVIIKGIVGETQGGVIGQQDVGTPMLKVGTLGAGGGTLAWIGKDGLLKVGPQSAGATPGPACYARGGEHPTVTDANLVLGALGGSTLAGGLELDEGKAAAAIEAHVALPLGISLVEAADGIVRILNNKIAVDVRLELEAQGQDPRKFALMAFGGAGGLHAAEVARMVNIPTVLVPLRPGLNCALGLLQTSVRHQYLRSHMRLLSECPLREIEDLFIKLAQQAEEDARLEGFERSQLTMRRSLELRYLHQGYQLAVPCPWPFRESDRDRLREAFHERHQQIYGQSASKEKVEMVTFRLDSEVMVPQLYLPEIEAGGQRGERAVTGERQLWDFISRRFVKAPLYERDLLLAGDRLAGPAVIAQFDSTTILPAGQTASVDRRGTLIIETGC